ncbi:MAG: hypothetical protein WD873_05170 [Candidatus Hydrogenedentales bacterium]
MAIAAGCSDTGNRSSAVEESAPAQQAPLPDGLIVAQAPAGAMSIKQIKAEDHTGDEVTITGRIGGREEPFVAERAMFTMTDLTLPTCEAPADSCPTPWDSCCELPEDIMANMISVQVADESGAVLKHGLQGESGLDPLATLTIRGTVTQQDADVLVLTAKEIYVHPAG